MAENQDIAYKKNPEALFPKFIEKLHVFEKQILQTTDYGQH
jgi:hypothetical protein